MDSDTEYLTAPVDIKYVLSRYSDIPFIGRLFGKRNGIRIRTYRSRILHLVWKSLLGFTPHRHQSYHQIDAFPSIWLKTLLGKKYLKKLVPFFYRACDYCYNATDEAKSYSYGYKLNPILQYNIRQILRSDEPLPLLRRKSLFASGVQYAQCISSNRKHGNIIIPPALAIDLKVIDALLNEIENKTPNPFRTAGDDSLEQYIKAPYFEDKLINQSLTVRKTVVSSSGVLPNSYEQDDFGRLQGKGNVHPQRLTSVIRHSLLQGCGLWNYDFRACHPTIIKNLADYHNIPCPRLTTVLDCRDEIFRDMGKHLGQIQCGRHFHLPPKLIKELFNRFPYGTSIDPEDEAFDGYNGYEILKTLHNSPHPKWGLILKQVQQELVRLRLQIIEKALTPDGRFIQNLHGHRRPVDDPIFIKFKKKKPYVSVGSQLSFILTWIESAMLDIVCSPHADNTVLCFDGWISPKRDVKGLERLIQTEFPRLYGIPMTIKIKEEPI